MIRYAVGMGLLALLVAFQAVRADEPAGGDAKAGVMTGAAPQESPSAAPESVSAAAPAEGAPAEIAVLDAGVESASARAKPAFEVGARFLYASLLSDTKGTPHNNSFIGSIYKLDAEQHLYLPQLYAQYMPSPYIGFGLSYDYLEAATVDNGGGDGDVQCTGLLMYLTLAYPTEHATPYAELGVGFYRNDFAPHPNWSRGGMRKFELDDTTTPYYAIGCRLALSPEWSLDLYGRYVDLDVDGEYIFQFDRDDAEPFTFTMENISWGLGAAYRF